MLPQQTFGLGIINITLPMAGLILQTCKCHHNLIVSCLPTSAPPRLCSSPSCHHRTSILRASVAAQQILQGSRCRKDLQITFCGTRWCAQQLLSCFFTHLQIFRPSVLPGHGVISGKQAAMPCKGQSAMNPYWNPHTLNVQLALLLYSLRIHANPSFEALNK